MTKRQRPSPAPRPPPAQQQSEEDEERGREQQARNADAAVPVSASATPAPACVEDWFLPASPPFKLPPREARAAAAAGHPPGGGKKPRGHQQQHDADRHPQPRHPPPPKRWRNLRQLLQGEGYEQLPVSTPTYANIAAPPSTYPPKRYCDLTGLEAPYVDPKTGLRYASAQLFGYLRALPPDGVQARLALRRAEIVLK